MCIRDRVNIPFSSQTDLLITSDLPPSVEGSIEYLNNNCLISVNGRIYPMERVGDRLYVKGCVHNLEYLESAAASVIDFARIGGIEKHVMVNSDITVRTDTTAVGTRYQSECVLECQHDSLIGKKIIFIESGHMHIFNGFASVIDVNKVLIKLNHRETIQKILRRPTREHAMYISTYEDDRAIDEDGFVAENYLSRGDTMIITLENDDVNKVEELIPSMGLIGKYSFYRPPTGIVMADDGRLADYNVREERPDEFVVSTLEHSETFFVSDTVTTDSQTVGTNATNPHEVDYNIGVRAIDIYRLND